jgi:O-methyltransferase
MHAHESNARRLGKALVLMVRVPPARRACRGTIGAMQTVPWTDGAARKAKAGDFSDTSEESVREKLPYPEKAVFHRGWFPETFRGLEGLSFCFVSVDADLYAPTASALPVFWERLSPGGAIMVHDYNSLQYKGVKKAVDDFCTEIKILPFPVPDLHGSCVIRK